MRFSNHADAVRALSDMDGYSLRGVILTVNPGTERTAQQNAKVSKDKKDDSKGDGATKNKTTTVVNGFVDNRAVVKEVKPGSSKDSTLPSPQESKTVAQVESWKTDGRLSPKTQTVEKKKFFSQDNYGDCINAEGGSYPIHVSNFPVGTTQVK